MPELDIIKVTDHSPPATAKQVGGSHYKNLAIQPAQYMHENKIDYLAGNAIKYLTRYKSKNGAEDIKKAKHYCEMILEMEYGIK